MTKKFILTMILCTMCCWGAANNACPCEGEAAAAVSAHSGRREAPYVPATGASIAQRGNGNSYGYCQSPHRHHNYHHHYRHRR